MLLNNAIGYRKLRYEQSEGVALRASIARDLLRKRGPFYSLIKLSSNFSDLRGLIYVITIIVASRG